MDSYYKEMILKVVGWTFWLSLGVIFSVMWIAKDFDATYKVLAIIWLVITAIIACVKWMQYRKENPALTKEQKQNLKQWKKEEKYRNSAEFKKKFISEVEIENAYFGKGILVKDSSTENVHYKDIKSGFDRIFDSFGKKSDFPCDLGEFLVDEDNLEYVLDSLEKIYKKSDQIMEGCYEKIYKEIIEHFEKMESSELLKDEFDLEYLKENWRISNVRIYDDGVEFSLDIDMTDDLDGDAYYDIEISIAYSTQEAEVSFEAGC